MRHVLYKTFCKALGLFIIHLSLQDCSFILVSAVLQKSLIGLILGKGINKV